MKAAQTSASWKGCEVCLAMLVATAEALFSGRLEEMSMDAVLRFESMPAKALCVVKGWEWHAAGVMIDP